MKISTLVGGLAAACIGLSAPGLASAAHRNVLPEASRSYEGGRSLQVLVAQSEIKSDINPSDITAATGGGLIEALIDAKINSDRAKRAEREIQPLRAALTGYDVDALAKATTDAALAKTPWLQVGPPGFGRDTSVVGKSAALDASQKGQVAFFEYSYDLSPDFASIRVVLSIQLANKAVSAGDKPESRLSNGNLTYAQRVVSVVSLASPSKQAVENAARWSADDAKLARKGLAMAFDAIGALAPRALELTEADLKTMGDHSRKNLMLAGYVGRVQEQTAGGALLFNGGLVRIQTLAE